MKADVFERFEKDPRQVEVILREAKQIIRMEHAIITETKHGFICANSGVDKSNMPGEHFVSLLPRDPEKSAREIRKELEKLTGVKLAVIISDTHGRPFREGAINVAIGVSGMKPVWDRRGDVDLFGYTLKSTLVGIADELASAAELVMGEANEGIPVVIIRGFDYIEGEGSIKDLLRAPEKDMFR
jgi:coenzyme F420-0:L-glutamate ligase/coenzyme F420-1:gamma-L-glutamate ligase